MKRKLALVAAILLPALLFSIIWSLRDSEPYGTFRNRQMGSQELCYFEFTDGEVYIVIKDEYRSKLGDYHKSGGQWIMTNPISTNILEANCWRVRMTSADGAWSKAFPRVLVRLDALRRGKYQ